MLLINIDIHIVSSVSARKLICPSSARLGSGPFQLGSARTHHYKIPCQTNTYQHQNKSRYLAKLFSSKVQLPPLCKVIRYKLRGEIFLLLHSTSQCRFLVYFDQKSMLLTHLNVNQLFSADAKIYSMAILVVFKGGIQN